MTTSLTVTEARATLPDVLDRVAAGEEVAITRHGKVVAVVVRPDSLRTRRADRALELAGDLRRVLETGRRTSLAATPRLSKRRADELVDDVRAGR